MIIDFHSHLAYAPIYPDRYLSDMFLELNENERSKLNRIIPILLRDKNGEVFLRQMDLAGIDKAVLLIIDGGVGLGEAKLSIGEIYEIHHSVLKNHPDRFIVFAGIDPRRGKIGYNLFRKGIETYNFKGLKLYPPMGYSMDHLELTPYYEYCQQNRLPVLLHTGPSQRNLRNELANPLFIRSIAEKYQNINFILAHAGFNLSNDLIKLIKSTKNIYIDIAGFQSKYKKFDQQMINDFAPLFTKELNKKVLFGNDWPLFNFIKPLYRNIEILDKINVAIDNKIENALENIMFNNAINILMTSPP